MKSFIKIFVVTALLFTLACQKANNTEVSVLTQLQAQAPEFKIAAGHSPQAVKTIKVKSLAEAKKVLQELQNFSKRSYEVTAALREKREQIALKKAVTLQDLIDRNQLLTRNTFDIYGACGGTLESGFVDNLSFSVMLHCVATSVGSQGPVRRLYDQWSVDGISYSTSSDVQSAANSLQITSEDPMRLCFFGGSLSLAVSIVYDDPDDPEPPQPVTFFCFFMLEGMWNAQGGGGCNITFN